MDELRLIFIKISLWKIFMDLIVGYGAYRVFKKSKSDEVKMKTKKVLKVIGVMLIIVIFWDGISILKDNIFFSPHKKIVKVVEIRDYKSGGIINQPVLMDNKNEYYFYFWSPKVEEGKTYEITYLPNTEAVVKAVEIKK
ncbi:hypothetical protein [Oceanirhabdus sp. W0125-5]|uniref:hypothetical protein n=1 Tax=Oceanirhabdus sp. W0125-5 TaxID=2999116 RepID=UPI0022F31BB3|nr:hypothetical protein [Oceanirhabdus sp. W0125-5]WBW97316.1 hypothetical protein OW730_00245 [Oceanirhabdus sp. W0125-5]